MNDSDPVTVLHGGDVVTMDGDRNVLVGGAVAIHGDVIVAVGSTRDVRSRFPTADLVDVTGDVLTPGLVNGHQHTTGDPLVRCCIPDLIDSSSAIYDWAVPIHEAHTPDDDEAAATLTSIEALTNGVTTIVEAGTVAHPDRVARALEHTGIRSTLGSWGWDADDVPYGGSVDVALDRQRAVLGAYPSGGRVEGWVTLVGHDLCSDELVVRASELARTAGTNMTLHMSPTAADAEAYLARTGRRPLVHLAELGALGPHVLIGHGVWLDDAEVDVVLETGTAIAYCPWAYLRLGQGTTRAGRHVEIVQRGGRVVLGCDAGNAGDAIDVLATARAAAGIARDAAVDPTRFGAHQAFELATIAGAEAIGMADRVGSIEVGKQADIVVHRTDTPGWTPRGDVGLQLVWGTDGRSVRDVWVAGRQVVSDGRPTAISQDELAEMATHRQTKLLERAGIEVPHLWPHHDAR